MDFTNHHFSAPEETVCIDTAPPVQEPRSIQEGDTVPSMPRLREVTNSPAQEYAIRPGNVTPLPDNVAALICSFKGRAEVQRNGIKVERKELSTQPLYYWHEDSLTCLAMQGQKVIYVINPNTLDCIHIMDASGRYLETVVRKNLPDILDTKAQAKEISKHKAYMTRQQTRLQELHAEDTEEILERHRNNSEEMQRSTNVHPAEAPTNQPINQSTNQRSAAPTTADRLTDRGQSIQTHINNRANQRESAANFGSAMRNETPARPAPVQRDETPVEDFTEAPAKSRTQEPTTTAEIW